jgi:hypothetical protein
MAAGSPLTVSSTAPQKQLPRWVLWSALGFVARDSVVMVIC